jgi:hypothetical protein
VGQCSEKSSDGYDTGPPAGWTIEELFGAPLARPADALAKPMWRSFNFDQAPLDPLPLKDDGAHGDRD